MKLVNSNDPTGLDVLFVCTANISRSPYAEVRMAQLFGEQLAVASAGIPGFAGREMDPEMAAALPHPDGRATAHTSRPLTRSILDSSDLVLTMEFGHQRRILEEWPHAVRSVFGLRQFVSALDNWSFSSADGIDLPALRRTSAPNSTALDVKDPYGLGSTAARRCADELDDLLVRLGLGLGLKCQTED